MRLENHSIPPIQVVGRHCLPEAATSARPILKAGLLELLEEQRQQLYISGWSHTLAPFDRSAHLALQHNGASGETPDTTPWHLRRECSRAGQGAGGHHLWTSCWQNGF